MTPEIVNSSYVKEILALHESFPERKEFHKQVGEVFKRMSSDDDFMKEVIKRNFKDQGFLNQVWTGYNIPFLYIFENDFINLKIHLFPPHPEKKEHVAAHCIHHHNNYMLTTYAFFGGGYETCLFEKNIEVDSKTGKTNLQVRDNFKQTERNPHLVDAWEPHVVFIPQDLSATMVMWTPDKVRSTDNLRNNPILKSLKTPLRRLINALGMDDRFGISASKVYQFYVHDKQYYGIEEEEYFSKTKAEKGSQINEYSAQMLFAFFQRSGLFMDEFFRSKLSDKTFPQYYKVMINRILGGENLPDVYHRTEINIPNKTYTKKDILEAV